MQNNSEKALKLTPARSPHLANLTQLLHFLTALAQQNDLNSLYKNYKQISRRLSYFIRWFKGGGGQATGDREDENKEATHGNEDRGTEIMARCLSILRLFLRMTEYEKYGHRLGIFWGVVRKWGEGKGDGGVRVVDIIDSSEKSWQENTQSLQQISWRQLKFLCSQNVQNFFEKLVSQSVTLPNKQCVTCSQVFIKSTRILNQNPLIPTVAALSQKKGFDFMVFQTYLNAVCNTRGGVIVIGMGNNGSPTRNGTRAHSIAVGLRFAGLQEIQRREAEIRMAIYRVKPLCRYSIDRVIVHTNYARPKKIADQNMRICFRITIFPSQPSKISYCQISNNGYQRMYQVYKFDSENKPVKITKWTSTSTESARQSLYTSIHKAYKSGQSATIPNSHPNIWCDKPYPNYSHLFLKYVQDGFPKEISSQGSSVSDKDKEGDEDEPNTNKGELNIRHRNLSLLIVASKKYDRFVLDLAKVLKDKKQLFQIFRPFQACFRDGGRSIWAISHQMNFIQLRCFPRNSGLIMMPVFPTLEIQLQKYLPHEEYIRKKFLSQYAQIYDTETALAPDMNKKLRTVNYLHFSSMSESIFTYMIFQELQLRPYFTRDGNNLRSCAKK